MILKEIARELDLVLLTPEATAIEERDVVSGQVSDLLSDVLAHASEGGLLVTIQVHLNVVAVAVHSGLAAVIFAGGLQPEEEVRKKAEEEGIALYSSSESSFDLAGKLYARGLRGEHE